MKLTTWIDNCINHEAIVDVWRHKFATTLNEVDDEPRKDFLKQRLRSCPIANVETVTPEEVCVFASALANNKCPKVDCVPNEVYKYCNEGVYEVLAMFYSSVLTHSFVPTSLTDVVLTPILKNKLKDPTDSTNYRPISVASAGSRLLEDIVLDRLKTYLFTSDYQFGFKDGVSTNSCIFAVKEVINYYRCNNSYTFMCFIDIKSAFDRVSYNKLFLKLLDRGAPAYLVRLLLLWYQTQRIFVQWGLSRSSAFGMMNGIKQGSSISPLLFNVYIDELSHLLARSGVGCHIGELPMNNFAYADDLVLLAPTTRGLNVLLEICSKFASSHFIKYSIEKTVCMAIHPKRYTIDAPPNVYLDGRVLVFVEHFKYLGHIITSDFTDDADIMREVRSLSLRGNMLTRKFFFCSMDTKLYLFKVFCCTLVKL